MEKSNSKLKQKENHIMSIVSSLIYNKTIKLAKLQYLLLFLHTLN